MDAQVRQADNADQQAIETVTLEAFGPDEGPEIIELITALLRDPTAQPLLSLVATVQTQVVGHILFTSAGISDAERDITAAILAPLSVLPAHQNQGIGGLLINTALQELRSAGTALVFVLGYPAYYSRYGFSPARCKGFEPSYAILPENEEAWMVQALEPTIIGQLKGTVHCADALDNPKYWRED